MLFRKEAVVNLAVASSLVAAAPCDIYASGKTPCVAAHSTTRALYDGYKHALYQVKRISDGKKTNIYPVSSGGIARAATQDAFCNSTTCYITTIYDQSGIGNHLTMAPPGGAASGPGPKGYDALALATGAPVALNGQRVYGVLVVPGVGYRRDNTTSIATGDQPEGIYAILDGTNYNDACCFDYGNAEVSNLDTGAGHMEAIYFGNNTIWGSGVGEGPWIMADLENNLFAGQNEGYNPKNPAIHHRFVQAIVKGKPNYWAIRGGDATGNTLKTIYQGARPTVGGYNPMSKEGAIILGIGGDNSNGAMGTFYEGAMTAGYPSDATENLVHANVAQMKYTVA